MTFLQFFTDHKRTSVFEHFENHWGEGVGDGVGRGSCGWRRGGWGVGALLI